MTSSLRISSSAILLFNSVLSLHGDIETLDRGETFHDLDFVANGFATMSHTLTPKWLEQAFLKSYLSVLLTSKPICL